jgi:hypothetical protein
MANEPGTTAHTAVAVNESSGEYTCPYCQQPQSLSETYVLLENGVGCKKCPDCEKFVFVNVPQK